MLHGGTNSVIQPVMGGGGSMPSNYNVEASMLTGGTEPILKVLGGGAKGQKFTKKMQGEVYQAFETDITKQDRESYIQKLLTNYARKMTQLDFYLGQFYQDRIKNIKRYLETGAAQNPELPTLTQAQVNAVQYIPLVYDVLPSDVETIVMIPPINGNLREFIKIIQYLFKTEVFRKENSSDLQLKNGVAIVCMAPFYSGTNVIELTILMYLHMRLWNSNKNYFYVLHNPEDINTAKLIHLDPNGADTLPAPNDVLFTSLNPSVVVSLKEFGNFKGCLLTSQPGQAIFRPRKDKNAQQFAAPSKDIEKRTTFAVHPSSLSEDEDLFFENFLLIGSQGYKADLIQPRTDVNICKGLDTIFYDEDIANIKQYHISNKKYQIHVFRFDRIQETPLLCFDEDGNIAKLIPPPGKFASKEKHPRFEKASTKIINVGGIPRKIRIPTNPVMQNWSDEIYSKDEAELLNSLQLTPSLLAFVFENEWKKEVTGFLKKLVISNCFTDVRIITKSECDSVRNFINKIMAYFYANAAFTLDEPPIRRMIQPKVVIEEPAPIVEPRQALPQIPQPPAILTYAWPGDVHDVQPAQFQFQKKRYGTIRADIDRNDYYVDFIAVQKQTGSRLFKRLRLPIEGVKETANQRGVNVVLVLTDKMAQIEANLPDFIFIY